MIIYQNSAKGFKEDVDTNNIVNKIEVSFKMKLGRRTAPKEMDSWRNSLSFMERVVRRAQIADDCGVLLEYVIPATSKRIDFLIAGKDEENKNNFVIIELKQWQRAEKTDMHSVVRTALNGGIHETPHPSYQASSYKAFMQDYHSEVDAGSLNAYSCAYLHNYTKNNPEPLLDSIYTEIISDSPIYFKEDQEKLENFLKKYIGKGKGLDILYKIESGKIKPTKKLIDHVLSLYEGNQDFTLLDEQKVAFETACSIAKKQIDKSVVIIKGGPGTGKSVISMNLVAALIKDGLNIQFVAPNSSFRNVMIEKLAGKESRRRLNNIFKGSSSFVDTPENTFDAIIIDEAHRLKNGTAYQYRGKNQVEDIVKSTKCSIFFVDDNQVIRPEDIGNTTEIKRIAKYFDAETFELELEAQFRCAGAEGFINWLDDVLQLRQTGNFDGWDKENFDFKIFDNPNNMNNELRAKKYLGNTCSLLAGYAWDWSSVKEGNSDSQVNDIKIMEHSFERPWNSRKIGSTWALSDSNLEQVGCIHTSQGLEFDYVGVIVGNDLKFSFDSMSYYTNWSEYKDMNGKKGLREKPEELNKLVRNIYKILMTRGMKGCYVYFMDKDVEKHFLERENIKS